MRPANLNVPIFLVIMAMITVANGIWVIEYNQTISGNTHNQAYYMGSRLGKGCSYFGPTQNLIDSYQCLDGLPITESPLYNENSPFTNRDPRLDMYCARPIRV